ncbi:MAG: DMT family transporter [Euryarchaeota archaeon]|nr:DMT family transporter [Euryarchaeota archaeon]
MTYEARRTTVALILVQILFGTLSVAGKFALTSVSPMVLSAVRVTLAALVLYALQRIISRETIRSLADYRTVFVYSVFGVTLNQLLFLNGLALTTATNATLLITTIPVITIIIGAALGREKPMPVRILGVAFSLLGVAVLLGLDRLDLSDRFLVGNILVVLNSASFAFFLVISRDLLSRYQPLTIAAWTFIFGSISITAIAVPDLLVWDALSMPTDAWLAILYIVAFPTVTTYYLNNWALKRVSSSHVSSFIYLQPLVTAALAISFLGETIMQETVVGGALVLAGVFLATRAR